MAQATLEERVSRLEQQIAELSERVESQPRESNWVEEVTGSSAGVPESGEVLHRGRKAIESDGPDDYRELPFFGMWRDRDDMQDSTAWVRAERERWQQRRTRQD